MEERYVARHSLIKESFDNVGDSVAKADVALILHYTSMTSIVKRRATHQPTLESRSDERYSPMMLRYPRYTILSSKLLAVLFNESPYTLFLLDLTNLI